MRQGPGIETSSGELDPWRLNLHTKMRSGGNGMWGQGPAQRKNNI
jgi:hypothetical protein